VNFGSASFSPTMQHPQALSILVTGLDPTAMSAGSIAVSVSQSVASGLAITSGLIGVSLRPTVATMTLLSVAAVSAIDPNVYGTIGLSGQLLGGQGDYVEFALVRNGVVAVLLDLPDPSFNPPADQSQQQFAIPTTSAIAPGVYFAVFRVNGQQAVQTFNLNLAAP
jgi:hypothetical protein